MTERRYKQQSRCIATTANSARTPYAKPRNSTRTKEGFLSFRKTCGIILVEKKLKITKIYASIAVAKKICLPEESVSESVANAKPWIEW